METITTLPVYSRLSTAEKPPDAPYPLAIHQERTLALLVDPAVDVVINTAMTGDGKSLAAFLPALVKKQKVLALYPTNELLLDQQVGLRDYLTEWGAAERMAEEAFDSARLTELRQEEELTSKAALLARLIKNRDILLTNPDIFHYIMQGRYLRQDGPPDAVFAPLVDLYDLFVFDEFHIFGAPQISAVLAALLLIYAETERRGDRRKKFLFLSATPLPELGQMLERAGLRVETINGDYRHESADPGRGWRRILAPATLHFDTVIPAAPIEAWVTAHLEDTLLAFYRQHPGARGALIVNSVAAARRLVAFLSEPFRQEKLTVHENSGLSDRAERERSRRADLLVGTSTVDVGVDFHINFLIFESLDAATFLQRLGRLGRHAGYHRPDDDTWVDFHHYEAIALVPAYVQERLFVGSDEAPAHLTPDAMVNRETLRDAMMAVYPAARTFDQYAGRWGSYLAAHVVNGLRHPKLADVYQSALATLIPRYDTAYGVSIEKKVRRLYALKRDTPVLADEVLAFRGGSPFECAVVDDMRPTSGRIKTYDLLALAGQFRLDWLDWSTFREEAERAGVNPAGYDQARLLGAVRLVDLLPERRAVVFWVGKDVGEGQPGYFIGWNQVLTTDKIELNADVGDWVAKANATLKKREVVCLLTPDEPTTLRTRRLPPLFAVYPFKSKNRRDGGGSIVFARQALLLETLLFYRKPQVGDTAYIL